MKLAYRTLCVAVLIGCSMVRGQEVILDTGPIVRNADIGLGKGSHPAYAFTVTETYELTSIEGLIFRREDPAFGWPGELKAVLYSDGQDGLPSERLFESRFFVPNQSDSIVEADWYGPTNVGWRIDPGTYWVGFAVDDDNPFGGTMPFERADDASIASWIFELPENGGPFWIAESGKKLGIRVAGRVVPEPASAISTILSLIICMVAQRRPSSQH